MEKYILNEQGQPVVCDDVLAWGRWYQAANRTVALDKLDEGKVSTVFLGLDHAFTHGPPVLWETLVFGGALDGECERYSSREDAERGHAAMVARVKTARPDDAA